MNRLNPSNIVPTYQSFVHLAGRFNRIPVSLAFHSDLETPLSAYLKLSKGKNAFLLESVEKNEQVARYSIVGFDPSEIFQSKGGCLTREVGKNQNRLPSSNPLRTVQEKISPIRQAPLEGVTGFLGGLVGFVGYDTVRYFEKLPQQKPDLLNLPDFYLMMTDQLVLFDHLKRTMRLIVNVPIEERTNLKKAYQQALQKISNQTEILEKNLKGVSEIPVTPPQGDVSKNLFGFKGNMTQEDFEKIVLKSKEYIRAGDIIQVVGALRFEKQFRSDSVTLYRILRRLNPSPYMFLLKMNGIDLVGSSPEMLIKVQEGVVETRPIAGSRPRGATPEQDQSLGVNLLKDQKELAEHVMLVDLARNDLGRVCEFGTVRVNQFEVVERYSHIMHIVSDVTGKLLKGKTAFDAFQACFPAGTLSGAPKIRAMEIIEELEPSRRGAYGGAIVAFGFDGSMDSAITIRSALLKKDEGGILKAYVQAGAGLVADSIPENEYRECCNKARAVLMAVDQAERAANSKAPTHPRGRGRKKSKSSVKPKTNRNFRREVKP